MIWDAVLTAFAAETALTIAHIEIDVKSNEISAAQQLVAELRQDQSAAALGGYQTLTKSRFS